LSDLELVQLLAQEAQLLLEDHSGGDGREDGRLEQARRALAETGRAGGLVIGVSPRRWFEGEDLTKWLSGSRS
jgi:hypothetical protein